MAIRFTRSSSEALIRTTDLPTPNGDFTWMAWVYAVSFPAWQEIFCMQINNSNNWLEWSFADTGSTSRFAFWTLSGSANSTAYYNTATWYHIACTFGSSTAKGYVNGTEVISLGSIGTITSNENISLGCYASAGIPQGEYLDGRIFAQKMWTSVLTATDITREMYTIHPKNTTNLYAWWPSFPGSNERNRDYSGNSRNWSVYNTISDEDPPPISWGAKHVLVPYISAGTPTFIQEGYRWRNDNEDEDHATWAYDQDTEGSQLMNNNIRLRVLVDTTNDTAATQYRLEYRKHDSSDAWQTVTT